MAAIFRKILCPIDFSDNSIAALTEAAKLARNDDAMPYLMHVEFVPMSNPAKLADYMTVSTEPGRLRLQKMAQKRLAKVRHLVLEQVGWPAEMIEKAAKDLDVDLNVIATQGQTGINRLLLGSNCRSPRSGRLNAWASRYSTKRKHGTRD
jgi:nucleotide-binding universal stress UspA family protein